MQFFYSSANNENSYLDKGLRVRVNTVLVLRKNKVKTLVAKASHGTRVSEGIIIEWFHTAPYLPFLFKSQVAITSHQIFNLQYLQVPFPKVSVDSSHARVNSPSENSQYCNNEGEKVYSWIIMSIVTTLLVGAIIFAIFYYLLKEEKYPGKLPPG